MQVLLNKEQFRLTLTRMAHQAVEQYDHLHDLVFIAIQPRGVFVGQKIAGIIQGLFPDEKLQYGVLDITFYRDDIRKELHTANETHIPFSIENKRVVLIDDVLYTGRTIRAALDALQDFGRPRKVELCVLIDRRFKRELPIQADYFGRAIDTHDSQKVKVNPESEEVLLY